MEEDRPWKKLVRPFLGLLLTLAITAGAIWLYTAAINDAAKKEMSLSDGLQGIAEDLWSTGAAPEIREMDPDLPGEIARLRVTAGPVLQVMVLPTENLPVRSRGTHELLYLSGQRKVLTIEVFVDEAEGKIDVLSFQTDPGFSRKNDR